MDMNKGQEPSKHIFVSIICIIINNDNNHFDLSAQEFWDALALHYWKPLEFAGIL